MTFKKWCVLGVSCLIVGVSIINSSHQKTYLDCIVPIAKTNLKESDSFEGFFTSNQDFNFLGYGMQSIAFESSDHRYVLKFFTKKPFELNLERKKTYKSFSAYWNRWKRDLKFAMDIKYVLKNYSVLYKKNPEIAGLVAVHLDASNKKLPSVILHWPNNIQTVCDLNQYFFVVQKKANLVFDQLQQKSTKQSKQELINSLRQFLITRAKLGFMDKRKTMSMHKNFGFLDGEPVQFDAGNVVYNSRLLMNPEQEISEVLALFDFWLESNEKFLGFD